MCCFVLTSRIWCFRCLLSYLQGFNFNRDYQCSMSSEIHNLQLKFTFFLWFFLTLDGHLENPTEINLSRFGEFQKQGGLFTVFCARNNTSTSRWSTAFRSRFLRIDLSFVFFVDLKLITFDRVSVGRHQWLYNEGLFWNSSVKRLAISLKNWWSQS